MIRPATPKYAGRLLLLVAILFGVAACGGSSSGSNKRSLAFIMPEPQELVGASDIEIELDVPAGTELADLTLMLDDNPVDISDFTLSDTRLTGTLTEVADGWHKLDAEVADSSKALNTTTSFEAIFLDQADGCDILNAIECLLPYPSSQFLTQADTATGWRVTFPAAGMPVASGEGLLPGPYEVLDGFSPGAQVLMHFPDGVDLELSDAPRLRPELRVVDERSLDGDSPTLLIDADTGEQILHFVELDARTTAASGRQVLFLRPARTLQPGHRYIVAARHLLRADGSEVNAEPVFGALRDDRPSSIAAVEERRPLLEPIFDTLESAGIERSELTLAFDFVIGSDDNLARDTLSMRDQSFAWLQDKEAANEQSFTVDSVTEYDCKDGGTWKDIQGTFEVPLFLDKDPVLANREVGFMQYGDDGLPTFSDTMGARYTVLIPCASLAGEEVVRPAIYTHGSSGDFREVVTVTNVWRDNAAVDSNLEPPAYVFGSTDDFTVGALDLEGGIDSFLIGGVFLHLDNMKAIPDRQRQGLVNVLALGRMMKRGMFNLDPEFRLPNSEPVFPGPQEELYLWGISMGGYSGLFLGAFANDFERINAVVPASHFSYQFQRDTGFDDFATVLTFVFGPDTMTHALVISVTSELWSLADPATFASHVMRDPLPGSGPKKFLISSALDDGWSPNFYANVMVRSLGIPSLVGSVKPGLVSIDDVAGPLDSAYVLFGTGIDPTNPAHAPFLTPLANLSSGIRACEPHMLVLNPAYFRQAARFLRPGGDIVNTCEGVCDAQQPLETPLAAGACDPLAP